MDKNQEITEEEAKRIYRRNKKLVDDSIDSYVSLQNINKVYPNGVHAVYDLNLEVNHHDFVALVGPSGCGKSTTLRMIAGLEEISSGSLYIDKTYSNYLASKDRDIAMVFQSYALYPQMSVYDNIAFGLKIRHIDKNEIKKRVFEAANILDLGKYLDRKPKELSGGQMQRVALGRAIVRKAGLFLMDEPLSNLDAKLRVQMRSEIVRITKQVGATTIYVTHDQTEAMTMATKIAVMNEGFVQQIATPFDIYNHPNNLFVATFIGSPAMNIFDCTYDADVLHLGDYSVPLFKGFKDTYQRFCQRKQTEIGKQLAEIDTITDEQIRKMNASQIYKKAVINTKEDNAKKEKRKFSPFWKIKRQKEEEITKERKSLKSSLEKIQADYTSAQKNAHILKVGIRPEDIYLADQFYGKIPSKPITIRADLVELLGNEYIVHFNLNNSHVQIKVKGGKIIQTGEELSIALDESKFFIFDANSGMTIK